MTLPIACGRHASGIPGSFCGGGDRKTGRLSRPSISPAGRWKCSPAPVEVDPQAGWRHFIVEQRLLQLAGDALRDRVLTLRQNAARTEPAFAVALGLRGDAYAELYRLAQAPDAELRSLWIAAGIV